MKKIVVLIIFVLMLTGCSVKYNLVINEDLSIQEEAKLTGTDEFFQNYYKTTRTSVLKSNLEVYKDILDESSYEYEVKEESYPYVLTTNTYSNVNEYINNSKLFNDYFDEIKYTEDGDIKKIETVGFNENNPDDPNRFNVKDLTIAITCPFEVTDHNATEIDKNTNTYYFKLGEKGETKILFEYDVSKKYSVENNLLRTLIICLVAIVGVWISVAILNKNDK